MNHFNVARSFAGWGTKKEFKTQAMMMHTFEITGNYWEICFTSKLYVMLFYFVVKEIKKKSTSRRINKTKSARRVHRGLRILESH